MHAEKNNTGRKQINSKKTCLFYGVFPCFLPNYCFCDQRSTFDKATPSHGLIGSRAKVADARTLFDALYRAGTFIECRFATVNYVNF